MGTAVVTAVKALAKILLNEESRKKLGWTLMVILAPIIFIIIAFICLTASGTAQHNVKAIDLVFHGGAMNITMPAEFREHVTDMRTSFKRLDSAISKAESDMEGGDSLDDIRVKAIFYALYFGEDVPSRKDSKLFVACFYVEKTRTREVEVTNTVTNEDGSTSTETTTEIEEYIVHVPITDISIIYANIESNFGLTITYEDMVNANEIYYRIKYGVGFGKDGSLEDINSIPLSEEPFVGMDGFHSPIGGNWESKITCEFGPRDFAPDPYHTGIDFGKGGVTHGSSIYAVLDGTVLYTRYSPKGFGTHVAIDHGGGIVTIYAHCSSLLVSDGQQVTAGQEIAKVGTTGLSTGNHLHFEMREHGISVNPRKYLPKENTNATPKLVEQNINFYPSELISEPKKEPELISF